MKKLIITIAICLSLIGTVASAKVIMKKIEVTQKENIASIYVGEGEIKVYELKNASSTCYVSYLFAQAGTLRMIEHNISCVK
jgi:hypothetical protein